ncbi:MAG: hypothetical protein FWD32_00415 [Firmicutes bacterium]|nr:hypothetical protein [Bacillota bacterium]
MENKVPQKKRKRKHTAPKVMFVCTSNTCRSPMAESIFNIVSNRQIRCASAGVYVAEGEQMNPLAVNALKSINIKPKRAHKSKKIGNIEGWLVFDLNKIVFDPIHGTQEDYNRCAKLLLNWVQNLYNSLRSALK